MGEIWSHKLRSFLTIICVLLGVASLVLVVGMVNGLFVYWRVYSQEMGGINKISIYDDAVPETQKHMVGMSPGRTMRDAEAIAALSKYAKYVSPEIDWSCMIRRKGKRYYGRVQGVTEGIMPTNKYEIAEGRYLSDLDQANATPVIVLGTAVVKDLYDTNEEVVGTRVFVNGQPFTVIGVLKNYEMLDGSYNILQRKNQIAFIPITSMERRFSGSRQLSWLNVYVTDIASIHLLAGELENILNHTHRGVHDFRIETGEESLAQLNNMQNNFFIVGSGIGMITLVVGGIGIMNLMLASINERIREIGIRKALGAWNRDIFVQFIAESVTLATCGGFCGVMAGVGLITLIQQIMKSSSGSMISPPVMSTSSVIIGFAFSVIVGIFAGIYPAFRASRLDPIEALRYE